MDSARGKNPDPRRFLGDRRIDIVIVTLPALLRGILVALLNTRLRPNILAEFDHRPNQAQLYGLLPDCLLLGLRPGEAPDKAAAPFFLAHGTADLLVPYAQSVRLRDALLAAGKEVSLHTVEGADHMWKGASVEQLHRLLDATLAFLTREHSG